MLKGEGGLPIDFEGVQRTANLAMAASVTGAAAGTGATGRVGSPSRTRRPGVTPWRGPNPTCASASTTSCDSLEGGALLQLFKTLLVEPRRALLRQALAAGGLPESADLDALTSMLIGSFYSRYVTIAGIPDD